MSPRVLRYAFLAFLLCPPGVPSAFEIPLTRGQRAQKLVEEGQGQILRGEYQHAIELCTRAMGIIEDWAPAYMCRSEARMMVRDEHAWKDAWKAVRLDPQSGAPYRILGIMEFREGRYTPALMDFNQALMHTKLKPEDVSDIYYYRAQIELNQGNLRSALEDVNKGLGIVQGLNGDFSNWTFNSLRADIFRRQEKDKQADQDERRVVSLINERLKRRPDERAELLFKRAESYALLHEYEKSAVDYGEVLASDKDNMEVLMDRAYVYFADGKREDALKDLDRILKLDPRQLAALHLRALTRISLGDNVGAIEDLNSYLDLKPEDASALADRGIARKFVEDYKGSLTDLNRAQALHSEGTGSLWGHRAFVEEMLGDHETAFDSAEKALKENPDDFSAHIARGRAAIILGRCEEAAPSLDWLVNKSPKSGYYLWLRGECRCNTGRDQGCLEDLAAAAGLEPQSQILAHRLASHYRTHLDDSVLPLTTDELRQSQKYYDKAAALGPLSLEDRLGRTRTMIALGDTLLKQGSTIQGRQFLREASSECKSILKNHPRSATARKLCKGVVGR